MKVKNELFLKCLIIFLIISVQSYSQSLVKNVSKPNIVFIVCDDLGWKDLGVYGSTFYETPNIDHLASQGMQFMDAYSTSPVCSPSRSSIVTGQYPVHTGITDVIPGEQNNLGPLPDQKLIQKPFELNLKKSEITIAQALKEQGYVTCFAGKWHLGLSPDVWPEKEGFDFNYGGWAAGSPINHGMTGYFSPYNNPKLKDGPKGEFLPDRLTKETIKFIKKVTNLGKPFFAFLSFYAVHEPIQAKEEYIKRFQEKAHKNGLDTTQAFISGTGWMQQNTSFKERIVQSNPVYAALLYSVDENVGRILQTLNELGISDNTVIVFTSDNGGLSTAEGSPTSNFPLRYGKGWNYDGGIRIPLIIKWPHVIRSGSVNKFPVINTDIYPTFLQIAGGGPLPAQHLDGVSLVPLLEGKKSINQRVLFWHYPHYGNQGGSPSSAMREGEWKLVQYYEDNHVELYNLSNDIEEQINLAKSMPGKTGGMLKLLNQWKRNMGVKIPSINPYYNPYSFKELMDKYHIKSKFDKQLRPFLKQYDTLFSKKIYDPTLVGNYIEEYPVANRK